MKRTLGLWATLALSLLLTACGSDSDSGKRQPTAAIQLMMPSSNPMALTQDIAVKLDGSSSDAANGAQLTYLWALESTPAKSQAKIDSSDQVTSSFTADVEGDYVVSLKVNNGDLDSKVVNYTFTAATIKPTAVAEPTINVSLGADSVGLSAKDSRLPAGLSGPMRYQWTLTEKPATSSGKLLYATSMNPTLQLDVEVIGQYKLQLVVSFNGVDSDPVDVVVNVTRGNVQPVAKASDVANGVIGQKVALDASSSTDADGDNLEYRWRITDGPYEPYPVLNNPKSAAPDFTPLAAGKYELTLFVFDGQRASDELEVNVTVTPDPDSTTNQPPVGELIAKGYYPSRSFGEQEVGLRANFEFEGYDPEGEKLTIVAAELLEKPEGSSATLEIANKYQPLVRKIQKLDVEGTYRVRITYSDGVNQLVKEATMLAKIGGVNNRPKADLELDGKAVLIGQPLIFNADASDPDDDAITYEWTLIDKPNGSSAIIQPVIHPDNGDYSRAEVVTDLPGVYRAHLRVKDDRGLYDPNPEELSGYAKIKNLVPEVQAVVWARNWGRLEPGENFYQILPCMSLLPRPVVVDPDGDQAESRYELITKPEGGRFTSSSYYKRSDCPNAGGQVFTKPGTYILRYTAGDGLSISPHYDFVVVVDPVEQAKGLRLRVGSDDSHTWLPLPYENRPTDRYLRTKDSDPIAAAYVQWSLTAVDGDYTIKNVRLEHMNGGLASLTPSFDGLQEGTKIKQGETLDFRTQFPAIPCQRTDEGKEGFHFSFNIEEIPEITFIYERWFGSGGRTDGSWKQCQPGQLD